MNTRSVSAGYLPPGADLGPLAWQSLHFGQGPQALEVRLPLLSPVQLQQLAAHVRQAGEALRPLPLARCMDAIDAAVQQLLDPQHPLRQQADALLPVVSGLDATMVRESLTAYLKTFRRPQLQRFVAEDFANPRVLDEFQPTPAGGWTRALGPGLLAHVWAGNTPGLPLWSLVAGLLVKGGSIGKVASAEPLMAGWFAQLVAQAEPALADALAVVGWRGGQPPLEQALLGAADVVLAYGSNTTLAQLRQQVPATTRFLPHGHKLSFGVLAASALDVHLAPQLAQRAALDVARYDQQGCYSPHMFYVARGGAVSPREWAQQLAGALDALEHRYPRQPLPLEEARSVAGWRQRHELQAMDDGRLALLGRPDAPWSVVYADHGQPLAPGALYRTVLVCAVDSPADVPALVAPWRSLLQTAGLATSPEELLPLAGALGAAGVTRLCALGDMAAPAAGWHHDGRFSLADLVTMVGVEASAETAAEALAPYRT